MTQTQYKQALTAASGRPNGRPPRKKVPATGRGARLYAVDYDGETFQVWAPTRSEARPRLAALAGLSDLVGLTVRDMTPAAEAAAA